MSRAAAAALRTTIARRRPQVVAAPRAPAAPPAHAADDGARRAEHDPRGRREAREIDDGAGWVSACIPWDDWDKAGPPFRIFGNTYYVGTCGIAAILIAGSEGHILIDGGPRNGGPLIADNVAVVPTFTPNDPNTGPLDCGPNDGTGLLYFLNITDATPVVNLDEVGGEFQLTRSDRTRQLIRGGITPSPSLLIAEDGTGGVTPVLCTGTECETPPIANLPVKTYWFEY